MKEPAQTKPLKGQLSRDLLKVNCNGIALGRERSLLETLDLVTRQMTAAVTRCSRDFRYLWVNQAYADWVQRPLDQVIGRPILEVLGKDAFDALRPYFERVLKGENVQYERETDYQGIGKRWVSATYTSTLDGNGAVDGWVAVVLDTTERHRSEEARFRHAAIVESFEDAIISKNLDAVITSWNAGAERIFGYTEAEAVGQPITILIPPDLRDEENKILARLRAGDRVEHYETRRISKNGEIIDVSLNIGPIRDSNDSVVGFTKIAHDITQRKRAEEAVRESEARFRLVADTAPVLIWMSDTDKLCTYFNKPWLDFTGRSIEQEFGNGWAEGVHPDDLQRCLDSYTQSFERREKFRMEYRLRRHDGEYRWVLDIGVPRLNQDRSFAGYIGIAVDVTENKDAEVVVRESEERFRLAAQLGGMFAYSWDAATDVIARSGESEKILGVKAEEVGTGAAISAMVHPDDKERFEAALANLSVENPTLRITYRIVRPDGAVKWLERNSQAYFDTTGNVERMAGLILDVTKHKLAEQALADMSRKLIESQEQERRRIGRELHDDINQRLAMLAVELEQLKEHPSEVVSRVEELRKQTTEISKDVQALSHELHSSKLEYLGALGAMKSWCREFAERQNIEVDCKLDVQSTLPHDIGLSLFRVLQEALHNAAKHSGVKRIEVELHEEAREIHLTIRDLGKGFDMEAAKQGRGLGLTSMQERVRLLNGTIMIESKPMSGTTIHVRLPLGSDQARRAAG